jgi:hypothetical protein
VELFLYFLAWWFVGFALITYHIVQERDFCVSDFVSAVISGFIGPVALLELVYDYVKDNGNHVVIKCRNPIARTPTILTDRVGHRRNLNHE